MSRLYYVMGNSGVGKDLLINFAKQKLNSAHPIIFSHRYITKRTNTLSENHIYLTPRDFKMRERKQLFSLHWESDGDCYGIGKEINYWMYQGFNVVVNGSREYLPEAIKRYKQLRPILIESEADNNLQLPDNHRITKSSVLLNTSEHDVIHISHNGQIENAAKEFISIITGIGKATLTF